MLEVTITGFEGAENHIQDVGDTDSRRVVESVWDADSSHIYQP